MNVLILSSSRKEIDPYYMSIARSVSAYLASNECDLVFGASSSSMMGACYEEFSRRERKIYSYTTEKYIDDLKNLNNSKKYVREDTFEMKRSMFNNSDLIVCLPGGTGTLSELFSYIEENRSNNRDVPIIIYDENNFYDKVFKLIEELEKNKFADEAIEEMYYIVRNKEEFINVFSDLTMKGKVK